MIHVVLGEQGSGKTTRLARLVREAAAAYPRWPVFILDLRHRMAGAVGNLAHPDADYRDVGDFLARGVTTTKRPNGTEGFACVHRANLFYQDTASRIAALAARFMQLRVPSIWCFDELDLFPAQLQPGHVDKDGTRRPKCPGYHILHYSRPVPLLIFGSARQPQNVDKGWLSQAACIDVFRCSTRQLLGQIRECGLPGASAVADRLPSLAPYSYLSLKGDGAWTRKQSSSF